MEKRQWGVFGKCGFGQWPSRLGGDGQWPQLGAGCEGRFWGGMGFLEIMAQAVTENEGRTFVGRIQIFITGISRGE